MTKKLLALCAALLVPALGLATQYANTAIVAKSGGDYIHPVDALSSLASWCPSASATSPCLVKILPGVYDLAERTPNQLYMRAHVDVEGAGQSSTVLKGVGGTYAVNFTGVEAAELRSLAVEVTAPPNAAALGVVGHLSNLALRRVAVRVSSGGYTKGIQLWGNQGKGPQASGILKDVLLEDVSVAASGAVHSNVAVEATRLDVTVRDSELSASGGTEAYGLVTKNWSTPGAVFDVIGSTLRTSGGSTATYGIFAQSFREVNLHASRVLADGPALAAAVFLTETSGSYPTVRADGCLLAASSIQPGLGSVYTVSASSVLRLGASRLGGSIPPASAGVACAASYSATYAPLDGLCQP